MAIRWIAAGLLEAEKQFRKMNGHHDMHALARALACHEEMVERGVGSRESGRLDRSKFLDEWTSS